MNEQEPERQERYADGESEKWYSVHSIVWCR
jgi:hypothetical protein